MNTQDHPPPICSQSQPDGGTIYTPDCSGGSPGVSCNGVFPFKTNPGLCARCDVIETHTRNGEQDKAQEVSQYPQCEDCGSFGRFWKEELCARCKKNRQQARHENTTPSVVPTPQPQPSSPIRAPNVHQIAATARAARPDAFQARSNTRVHPNFKTLHNRSSVTVDAPSSISGSRSSSDTSATIPCDIAVRFVGDTKANDQLGSVIKSFDENTLVTEIIYDALEVWNHTWTKYATHPLEIQDVSIRFRNNNANPLPNLITGTLQAFYYTHLKTPYSHLYFGTNNVKAKRPCLQLEALIDVHDFQVRTKEPAPLKFLSAKAQKVLGKLKKTKTKRRYEMSSDDDCGDINSPVSSVSNTSKRARNTRPNPGPPASRFNPVHARTALTSSQSEKTQQITLHLAPFELSDDGVFTVDWTPSECEVIQAEIGVRPVNTSGKMKKVFNVSLIRGNQPPEMFVAKRFCNIGNGEDTVTPAVNKQQINDEACRISLARAMLQEFYTHASESGVSVAKTFTFTDILLAREIPQDSPSLASGICDADHLGAVDIIWLLEPRRSTRAPIKWSGTMDFPSHRDQKGQTMDAFAHFSMFWSKNSFVMVDLQSTEALISTSDGSQRTSDVLFDVMSHSLAQSTGVGDHGIDGIRKFVADHRCGIFCKELGLQTLSEANIVLEDKAVEEEEDEDNNGHGDRSSGDEMD